MKLAQRLVEVLWMDNKTHTKTNKTANMLLLFLTSFPVIVQIFLRYSYTYAVTWTVKFHQIPNKKIVYMQNLTVF